MRTLGKLTIGAGTVAIAIAAITLAFTMGRCEGRRFQKAVSEDEATDVQVARTDSTSIADSLTWQRARDSLARRGALAAQHAAAAKHRADSLEAIIHAAGALVPKADVDAALEGKNQELAAKDAVIAQDSVGIRDRDTRIGQLLGTVASYRDTIVPALTRERNRWRRWALNRCGLEVTPGYAIVGRRADVVVGYGCRIPLPHLPFL